MTSGTSHARRPARGTARVAGSAALGVLMVVLLALAVAVTIVPRLTGAVPLTVLSGSMEPALSAGDVVVVRAVEADRLRVGDVVTFQPEPGDPMLVTHRIVSVVRDGGTVTSLRTQGDANGAADAPVVPEQVMGRVSYSVPLVGHVMHATWGPGAIVALGTGLVVYAALTLGTAGRSHRKELSHVVAS